MLKINNKGFMLVETLVVTIFVAGVLLFLFTQFSTLNNSYNTYYTYNTTEDLYALEDIKNYIEGDTKASNYIKDNIETSHYIDISTCNGNVFSNSSYCLKLLELENIEKIIVIENPFDTDSINISDDQFIDFMKKISQKGHESYRAVAKFKNGDFATIRINIQ